MLIKILGLVAIVIVEFGFLLSLSKVYGGWKNMYDLTPPTYEEQMSHDMTVFSPGSITIPVTIFFIVIDILAFIYG